MLLEALFTDAHGDSVVPDDPIKPKLHSVIPVNSDMQHFSKKFSVPTGAVAARIQARNAGGSGTIKLFGYSVSKELGQESQPICLRLLPSGSKCHWERAVDSLTPGCSYDLTVDEVIVESGKTSDVEVILYDAIAERYRLRKKFPVTNGRCEKLTWRFSVPEQPSTYHLLVYAGIAGKTENIGVIYKNIKVTGEQSPK